MYYNMKIQLEQQGLFLGKSSINLDMIAPSINNDFNRYFVKGIYPIIHKISLNLKSNLFKNLGEYDK